MNKDVPFVDYEQALELKGLGFDEECFGYYVLAEVRDYKNNGLDIRNEIVLNTLNGYRKYDDEIQTSAPLYQQAFRWFREKHGVLFWIEPSFKNQYQTDGYVYYVKNNGSYSIDYATYEQAEIECLKKVIEIVKNKQ